MVTNEDLINIERQLSNMMYDNWIQYQLFTWQWWLLLGLTFIPWMIWWKIVNKHRIQELLLFGFFVSFVAAFLNIYGWNRHMWVYPIQLLPICNPLLTVDFTVIPIAHMLVYQYFRAWKSFLLAGTILAFCFAFIAEPTLSWMGIYKAIKWKHSYSLPFYIGNAIIGKWVVEKLKPNAIER